MGDPKTTILMRKYDGTLVIKPQKRCNPRLSAWLSVLKPSTWFSASQFGRPWNCYEALSLDGPQVDPTMQLYPLAPQGAMRLGQLGQLMSRHPPHVKRWYGHFATGSSLKYVATSEPRTSDHWDRKSTRSLVWPWPWTSGMSRDPVGKHGKCIFGPCLSAEAGAQTPSKKQPRRLDSAVMNRSADRAVPRPTWVDGLLQCRRVSSSVFGRSINMRYHLVIYQ